MNKLPFIVRLGLIALVLYAGYSFGGVNLGLLLFVTISAAVLAEIFYWRKLREKED